MTRNPNTRRNCLRHLLVGGAVTVLVAVVWPPARWFTHKMPVASTSPDRLAAASCGGADRLAAIEDAVRVMNNQQANAQARRDADDTADYLERRLKALVTYVKVIERSLATIDTGVSTPSGLEKKLDQHKAHSRR